MVGLIGGSSLALKNGLKGSTAVETTKKIVLPVATTTMSVLELGLG